MKNQVQTDGFGDALRQAREASGMTQQELAQRLFVARQTLSRWECGERHPDLIMLQRLVVLLDTTADALLFAGRVEQTDNRTDEEQKR